MTKETQAWIKELDKESDGSLFSMFLPHVSYDVECSPKSIYLDGDFTIDQLQSLVDHMKKHQHRQT